MRKLRILKHILYAVLLGVSMAACLSQSDQPETRPDTVATAGPSPVAAAEVAVQPDPASFVIEKGHVGNVRLGTLTEDLRQHIPVGYTIADTTLQQEGMQATAYLLYPQNETKGLLVEQVCEPACHVWRIAVHNPRYKTAKGIGIGSTFSEVQRAYPISYVSQGEGNFVAVVEEMGLSFVLDQSQLPKDKLTRIKPADVPGNTVVKSILVY
ncbi:mechanosensitive ion channel protein MscS [Pontibacter liquoris]|uniref:mechanosensitive ion channel protein MscS n=1 Tax=Pontibacter liquoris TaxID=2905677 RepID=UPI001FA7D3D5|nr:mechanosensitive ion channel protein MscS [Pontibacter liquoris]